MTGGHFRNCTERAVGPGWAKNGIFELLLSLLISILDFSLFGCKLTTNPCLQVWTISMCMQYRKYLVMLLKVTAIFIAESVVTHKGVSKTRMFPQQLNGRFVQWCSPKWPQPKQEFWPNPCKGACQHDSLSLKKIFQTQKSFCAGEEASDVGETKAHKEIWLC